MYMYERRTLKLHVRSEKGEVDYMYVRCQGDDYIIVCHNRKVASINMYSQIPPPFPAFHKISLDTRNYFSRTS